MNAKLLAIIDYGMGNLHSVASAIKHVAPELTVEITADAQRVAAADHVIFPGVGAIRDCMGEIRGRGADQMVQDTLASGKPLLAICVGMQALMEYSDENDGVECLGVLRGRVKRFASGVKEGNEVLKVPHMGWNQVRQSIDHPLWRNINQDSRFYFVHSYFIEMNNVDEWNNNERNKGERGDDDQNVVDGSRQQVAGICHYGVDFCAAIARGSAFAVQFHPEKSHTDGLQLLKNFIDWNGSF